MRPIDKITGPVAALMRPNIDADSIIANRFCITTGRDGLGRGLFYAWRQEDASFVLNRLRPTILVTGSNFGCGSSREHAPWALLDFGIRVVVATSFGANFYENALRNGLIPVVLSETDIEALTAHMHGRDDLTATVSVADRSLVLRNLRFEFPLSINRREALLAGHDDIDVTLQRHREIDDFQTRDRERRSWAWLSAAPTAQS